jgi:hypothetical protein
MADTTPTPVAQPIPSTLTPSVIRPDGQVRTALGVERQGIVNNILQANRTPLGMTPDRQAIRPRPTTQTQNKA